MSRNTLMLASAAGALLVVLLADLIIVEPALKESARLDGEITKADIARDDARFTMDRETPIRSAWEQHSKRAPKVTKEDLEAAFLSDLIKLFEKARIRGQGFTKRPERTHGAYVELIFATSFQGSINELVDLMKVLDDYDDGYLRANVLQITRGKDKQEDKLDVKVEVSTIWFSAGNGGRS